MTDKVKQFLIRLIREAKGDSLLIDSENKFMTNEEFEKEWAEAQKYYEKHPEAADLDIIWGFDVPEADGISPIERYVLLKHKEHCPKIKRLSQICQEQAAQDLVKCFQKE